MTAQPIRTVGDLREALAPYPGNAHIGLYLNESEDGGLWIDNITVQRRRDDPDTLLYYKGENPLGEMGPEGLEEMVTLVGSSLWPDEVEPADRVPDELLTQAAEPE